MDTGGVNGCFERELRTVASQLSDSGPITRTQALNSVSRLPSAFRAKFLAIGLRDPHPMVRRTAVCAIAQAGDPEDWPDLVGLAQSDPYPRVRAAALRALAGVDGAHAEQWLCKAALQEKVWWVRVV